VLRCSFFYQKWLILTWHNTQEYSAAGKIGSCAARAMGSLGPLFKRDNRNQWLSPSWSTSPDAAAAWAFALMLTVSVGSGVDGGACDGAGAGFGW